MATDPNPFDGFISSLPGTHATTIDSYTDLPIPASDFTEVLGDTFEPPPAGIGKSSNILFLLYTEILENLNTLLGPELGGIPFDPDEDSEFYFSPERCAEQLMADITAQFSAFHTLHPELPEAQCLERFTHLIGQGIDKGSEQTKEILDSLNLLDNKLCALLETIVEQLQTELEEYGLSFGYSALHSEEDDTEDLSDELSADFMDQLLLYKLTN